MSSTSAPFGFKPLYDQNGYVRPAAYTLADNAAVTLYGNQPVKISSDGVIVAATVGDPFVGSFQGVEYTDVDGRRRVSNKFIANTTATEITAYITRSPTIVYEIQSNAALNITNIGNQFNFANIDAGSSTVGYSQCTLDVSSVVTSGSTAQMRLIGITPGPNNAWGDTYVIAQVQISEHQDVATINAY